MKFFVCLLLWLPAVFTVHARSYKDSISQFREEYVKELLADPAHPISVRQAKKLDFFPPDSSYRVRAVFTQTHGKPPFLIPTHSGKQKTYREYGTLDFYIHDTLYTLHVYQSVDLLNNPAYKNHLFIPFNDLTNYESTYGGGRYIDLSISDLSDGSVWLDFNKCYNPYCAYSDGFSCPIPPSENSLHTYILAGEKVFRH